MWGTQPLRLSLFLAGFCYCPFERFYVTGSLPIRLHQSVTQSTWMFHPDFHSSSEPLHWILASSPSTLHRPQLRRTWRKAAIAPHLQQSRNCAHPTDSHPRSIKVCLSLIRVIRHPVTLFALLFPLPFPSQLKFRVFSGSRMKGDFIQQS